MHDNSGEDPDQFVDLWLRLSEHEVVVEKGPRGQLTPISHNGATFRAYFNLNQPSVQWAPEIPFSGIRLPEYGTD
jgi:hypothetical protein